MAAAAPRRVVAGTPQSGTTEGKIGGEFKPTTTPAYIEHRLKIFDEYFTKQEEEKKSLPHIPITIELPNGKTVQGNKFEITPYEVAMGISKSLANEVIVAKITASNASDLEKENAIVDAEEDEEECGCPHDQTAASQLWDMHRPLEFDCRLELLKPDCFEAQQVFWHSSAHILGQALERAHGCHLGIGPALDQGFYYDCYVGDMSFSSSDYATWQKLAEQIVSEKQQFQRLVVDKEVALEIFKHNPFKVSLIKSKVPDGSKTSLYRCGTLVDLCRGPHVPNTGRVKAFSITKNSSSYWLGKSENDSMQRVYAISFHDEKLLKKYHQLIEQAKTRDHRTVGLSQNLFFFEPSLTPGSCFWLPDGTKIYNALVDYIRAEYRYRNFVEVLSPNIFSCDLFKVSGHYQNYKENMYIFNVEGKEWGLKPMNCPGHCLMFRHMRPSYKQLPLRMADFGVLHRNEISGSLSGLTRVRRFQQDDAHIFCRMDQVSQEVKSAMDFLLFVYKVLGFEFDVKLATRPKKALGEKALWDEAEKQLAAGLDDTGLKWTYNWGDGAFYGPKVDIRVKDALERWHQCGTIQLDFQLPLRFDLQYQTGEEIADVSTDADSPATKATEQPVADGDKKEIGSWESPLKPGYGRPVMVHRAILGSIERMTAVLVEHTGGRFPFWLSPRQAIICPISDKNTEYANWLHDQLHFRGYNVSVDRSANTFNKKIRQAQMEQWYFILVVGQQEQDNKVVTVRQRDDPKNQKQMPVNELVALFESLKAPHSGIAPESLPDWEPAKAE